MLSRTASVLASSHSQNRERQQWSSTLEFIMCCITMSIGLGNIWRFPFMAFENGGGAFFIPYMIVVALIGRPLYYLELALGQFGGKGNIKLFSALGRGFAGLGASQTFCAVCTATYYCCIIAIALFYFLNSFQSELPWNCCRPEWGNSCIGANNEDVAKNMNYTSSAELYFGKYVLNEKDSIDDGLGIPDWRLGLCLLFSWMCLCLILIEGVKTSGKASYFLATFPYAIIFIILGIATSLEGAQNGVYFFLKPDWSKLLEIKVWYKAVSQCFFALGIGFGTIIMSASYSSFETDINTVGLIMAVTDVSTCFVSGITIFSVLGNLAFQLDVEVPQVVKSGGMGIAFISYPTAISHITFAPYLMAIIFFLMLFVLGLGSMVSFQHIANGQIVDYFPQIKYWQVAVITSTCGFLLGLVYITPGGMFIFSLVDNFCVSMILFTVSMLEVLIIVFCYGLENVCEDIEFMTKSKVSVYWRITWGIFTPITLISIYIYYITTLEEPMYRGIKFPVPVLVMGCLLVAIGILFMPGVAIYRLIKNRHLGYRESWKKTFSDENWGPGNVAYVSGWKEYKQQQKLKRELVGNNRCVRFLKSLIGANS